MQNTPPCGEIAPNKQRSVISDCTTHTICGVAELSDVGMSQFWCDGILLVVALLLPTLVVVGVGGRGALSASRHFRALFCFSGDFSRHTTRRLLLTHDGGRGASRLSCLDFSLHLTPYDGHGGSGGTTTLRRWSYNCITQQETTKCGPCWIKA